MAAAAEQSILQSIVEARADIREVKEQLQGATGDKEVALQQQLAALRQKEVLLMQQQAGAAWSCACSRNSCASSCTRMKQCIFRSSRQSCTVMQHATSLLVYV